MATILIVDDHVLNRQFLTALLGFDQHTLLQAADGAEALALGPFVPPEPAAAPARLAVLDYQLSAYLKEVDAGRQLMSQLAERPDGTSAEPPSATFTTRPG